MLFDDKPVINKYYTVINFTMFPFGKSKLNVLQLLNSHPSRTQVILLQRVSNLLLKATL